MERMEYLMFAGWAAYLSALATIIMFVTGILFFTKGQPFGTIQDSASVFQMVFMLPMVVVLYWILHKEASLLILLIGILGVMGMLTAMTFQFLLVLKKIKYEQTVKMNLIAGALIGIWLLCNGYFSLLSDFFPAVLAVLGLTAGLSYILMMIGFWKGGEKNRLFLISSITGVISYTIWAIWLGGLLLSRNSQFLNS